MSDIIDLLKELTEKLEKEEKKENRTTTIDEQTFMDVGAEVFAAMVKRRSNANYKVERIYTIYRNTW